MDIPCKMQDLTSNEIEAVELLKDRVRDVAKPDYDDRYYIRWLIARDFDLSKAEKMMRDHLQWRKKYDIDNLHTCERPLIMRNYYPTGFCGEARDGTPVIYCQPGKMDVKGIYYGVRQVDLIKGTVKDLNYLDNVISPAQSKKHGCLIDQATVIYDFEGCNRKMLWKPMLDRLVNLTMQIDSNYPERIRKTICINMPWIFPVIWNIFKHALAEATKEKIVFLGSNWKSEIRKYIDADEIPEYWGGNAPDPAEVPVSEYDFCWGGTIPESLKNQKPDIDLSNFTTETVGRGSSLQVEVPIKFAGSILEWQFISEGYDIGFGVYRRTEDRRQKKGEMEEVYKTERFNSNIFPEDGSISCEEAGTYILRFDNTYSWTTAKTLYYTTDVLEPGITNDVHLVE